VFEKRVFIAFAVRAQGDAVCLGWLNGVERFGVATGAKDEGVASASVEPPGVVAEVGGKARAGISIFARIGFGGFHHISGNALALKGFVGANATNSGQGNVDAIGPVEINVLDSDFANWRVVVEGSDGIVLGFVGDVHKTLLDFQSFYMKFYRIAAVISHISPRFFYLRYALVPPLKKGDRGISPPSTHHRSSEIDHLTILF
jgi:hypothetical protein